MTGNKKPKVSEIIKAVYELHKVTHIKWEIPEVAIYISEYMDEHPEKKLTGRLRRKLKREYYRSLKEEKSRKKSE